MARNCVEENSLENVSQELVQTVPTPDTYPQASAASFDSKSEERKEITDVSVPALAPAPTLETAEEPGTYTPGSRNQQKTTLGSQPVHLVIFTCKRHYHICKRHYHICKDTSASGTVDHQSKMLNFELYVLYLEPN